MKNIKFFAREKLFSSREKNEKTAREKKNRGREKFEKWAKKWAWKTKSAREKNQENSKNGFHGHFFFSREKKNTERILIITVTIDDCYRENKCLWHTLILRAS